MTTSHNYDTIKIILLVLIVILMGYFVYSNIIDRRLGQGGVTVGDHQSCIYHTPWGDSAGLQVWLPNGTWSDCYQAAVAPQANPPTTPTSPSKAPGASTPR